VKPSPESDTKRRKLKKAMAAFLANDICYLPATIYLRTLPR
jgi:hypothetical protein